MHALLMRGSVPRRLMLFVDVMKELATFALRPFNFDTLAVQATTWRRRASRGGGCASLLIVAVGLVPLVLLSRSISRAAPPGDAQGGDARAYLKPARSACVARRHGSCPASGPMPSAEPAEGSSAGLLTFTPGTTGHSLLPSAKYACAGRLQCSEAQCRCGVGCVPGTPPPEMFMGAAIVLIRPNDAQLLGDGPCRWRGQNASTAGSIGVGDGDVAFAGGGGGEQSVSPP